MKPASLADISYSQALQILGMRKEALDSGEVQRLPRHLLEDSYYFRDAGEVLQEKRSFDFKKTLSDVWKNPTGKATLIGAGLGGVAGLGKTMADDEDDSYLGNIATGALGGGALGLGGGLAFDSKTRNSLVNKFQEATSSKSNNSEKPDNSVKRRVDAAMGSDNPSQAYVDAENAANSSDLNVKGRRAGVVATTAVPAYLAGRNMPGGWRMGGIDAAGGKPQAYNYDVMANLGKDSPTLDKMLREGGPQPRYGYPDSQNLYGLGPSLKQKPVPTPAPTPKTPSQVLPEAFPNLPPGENKVPGRNVSQGMKDVIDATNQSIPATPTQAVQPTTASPQPSARPSAAPVTGQRPLSGVVPGFDAAKQQVEKIMGGKNAKPETVVAYMQWSSASAAQKAKIVQELGLEAGVLSGKVKSPEILAALTRKGDNVAKGELLTDRSRMNLGQAIGETIETRSAVPMKKVLRNLPKGKIGAIMAALGLGYGAASYTGQTAGLRNAKVTRDTAELYRRKLQEAISKWQNGK
tara:strand:- start:46 stop:1608 length:1563 start_codon:yes stop_codon:yes gene_type:complete